MRLFAVLAALTLGLSATAQATDMAAHRALYKLTMDPDRPGEVVAATGSMGYEVIDACDGWAVRQRLEMTVTNHDGQNIQMVSDYATWEAKDGLSFRFHMKQTTDTAVTSETDGEARLDKPGGPGEARYSGAAGAVKPLPAGTLFPMAHTEAILAAAQQGKRFVAVPLFDGTTDSGAQDSFITILHSDGPRHENWMPLSPLGSTRVEISFFDRGPAAVQTPDYQVGMRYWENGVADNLKMDFGDFVMDGKMTEFTAQPRRC
ncbi:MAG: cell envelope integrity EipB family protein [Alphaproteobacteria bacterium]|nr:cell envelope integrity EipB family protein [Alphaproteobacteria bacterium]